MSMGMIWNETAYRLQDIRGAGYTVNFVHECKFASELKANPEWKRVAAATTVVDY